MKKACVECHAVIYGRIDKKFCDDLCRTAFHNKRLRLESPEKKRIENILKKNWKILKGIISTDYYPSLEQMRKLGFDFEYYTQSSIFNENEADYHCFDIAYRIEDNRIKYVKEN